MAAPFKDPRTGIYYFRRVIPAALRPFFDGASSEYKRTLKTKDAVEARQLYPQCAVVYGDIPIADYAGFSAERMTSLDANNHLQAGDPKKFAVAIVDLASNNEPPVWLAGGSEGYHVFAAKADALRDNAERWKDVSTSLDMDP